MRTPEIRGSRGVEEWRGLRQAHSSVPSKSHPTIHLGEHRACKPLGARVPGRRAERNCEQRASTVQRLLRGAGKRFRELSDEVRDFFLVPALRWIAGKLLEPPRLLRRDSGRTMRWATGSRQHDDGDPQIDNDPQPLGKSLEYDPAGLERPPEHLGPEADLLAGLLAREFGNRTR